MNIKTSICLLVLFFAFMLKPGTTVAQSNNTVFSNLKAGINTVPVSGENILRFEFTASAWQERDILFIQIGSMPASANVSSQIATISREDERFLIILGNGKKFFVKDDKVMINIPIEAREKQRAKYVTISSRSLKGGESNKISASVQ